MSPDLEAVLALQAEDTIVAQLNEKLRALDSQLVALDAERKHLEDSLARAKATAEQEEKKRREAAEGGISLSQADSGSLSFSWGGEVSFSVQK